MKKIEPYKDIATIYEEIRPSYPEELIEDIILKTNLSLEDKLLEIGAGTGKATVQFAEKGYTIDAIEIGQDMANILYNKCADYPRVSVNVVSFENWNNHDNKKYDMIYSAQAFHWIDKNIKYKKCHELLKDAGYLVLFWYNPSNDKSPKAKEIQDKVDLIINKYVSDYYVTNDNFQRREHDGVYKEDERKTEIEASGLFELIEKIEYTLDIKNTADNHLKAMKSVPAFASILDGLDDKIIKVMNKDIEEVIKENEEYLCTKFNFSLYITKKL